VSLTYITHRRANCFQWKVQETDTVLVGIYCSVLVIMLIFQCFRFFHQELKTHIHQSNSCSTPNNHWNADMYRT